MTSFDHEQPLANCTVAIAGLGLMGGSLGLALRGAVRQVIGIARRRETVQEALAIGAIDAGADDLTAAAEADLIVLATPVSVIMRQIGEIGELAAQGRLRPGVVLTDMGSTKQQICAAMDRLPDAIQPVGGHPMCGKETSGLDAADAALYCGAPFVLCPLPRTAPAAVTLVAALAEAIGARPLLLDAQRHDRLAAAISHVPYLAALATFAAADETASDDALAWQLAASGFRSTTRLAGSDPAMMTDILLSNQAAVLAHLDRLRRQLDRLTDLVAHGNADHLREAAVSTRAARGRFLDTFGEGGTVNGKR